MFLLHTHWQGSVCLLTQLLSVFPGMGLNRPQGRQSMEPSVSSFHSIFICLVYFLYANLCVHLPFFKKEKQNLSTFLFQLTYFHFHLFISGTVVFSVDFIGGLDTYSYRQPPQEHVELKPVKPVGKVLVPRTTLILLTELNWKLTFS